MVRIEGEKRVEAVALAEVGGDGKPVAGTEATYPCDTLLLSVGLLPENELSRAAGVELSGVTRGPVVDESLQTSLPGVYACGNVLHVHDLVDYVTQEAALAGRSAAEHAAGERRAAGKKISLEARGGVRYTVPQAIDPVRMPERLTVRFRVSGVFEDRYVTVRAGRTRLVHRRRPILVPGQMEEFTLRREDLLGAEGAQGIVVELEEA